MNITDLKEYFNLYVSNYQPYKDYPEYQAIVDTLINHYFNASYNIINAPFKQAFEEQIIPVEFYDNLLLSAGYPKKIISIFTDKDKLILLQSFMDYNRYKGTIEQVRKVGENFSESVAIYELYIDFREIEILYYNAYLIANSNYVILENEKIYTKLEIYDVFTVNSIEYIVLEKLESNGEYKLKLDKPYENSNVILKNFKIKRWVFIPDPIYKSSDVSLKEEFFDYVKIYLQTKRYFISVDQLMTEYRNERVVLPIKSNLLFLDYHRYRDVNLFHNLLAAIFLKEYYNNRLVIYFKDGEYSITLGRLYKLWYYVLMKFYNYDFVDDSPTNVVMIYKNNANFDYTISDIPSLVSEYEEITNNGTTDDYSQFYHSRITSKLKINDHVPRNISLLEYEFILENEVGVDLISYINNRILNSSSELREYEYNFILDEIYNSILTWVLATDLNDNISNNYKYLINNMSFISYPIEMSPTYNLVLFFKPYHVELITELNEYLKVRDIATSAIINDRRQNIYLSFLRASSLTVSDLIFNTIIYNTQHNGRNSSALITHGRKYLISQLVNELYKIQSELYYIEIIYSKELISQADSFKFHFDSVLLYKNLVFVISNAFIEIFLTPLERLHIEYDFKNMNLICFNETINQPYTTFSMSSADIDFDTSANIYDLFNLNYLFQNNSNLVISHDYYLI